MYIKASSCLIQKSLSPGFITKESKGQIWYRLGSVPSVVNFLESSCVHKMDCPDSPATIAIFQASIEAELAREKSAQLNSWQSTVEDMIHIPEGGVATTALPSEPSPSVGNPRSNLVRTKNRVSHGTDQSYNNHRNPIKTVPPPKAITVNNTSLKK